MHDRIEVNPRIHHGQPVIRGTRVPVTCVLAEVAAGTAYEEIQRQYEVTAEDIRAAVAFANELDPRDRPDPKGGVRKIA